MSQGFARSVSAPIMKMGGARVSRSTDQTLTTATDTPIVYDTVMYDDSGFFVSPDSIVIPPGMSGRYALSAGICFDINSTGNRMVSVNLNGSNIFSQRTAAFATNSGGLTISYTLNLVAGDVIKVYAYQSSGGDLSLKAAVGGGIHASIQRVGLAASTFPTGLVTESALTCNDNVLLGRLAQGTLGTVNEIPFSAGSFTPAFTFVTPGNLSVSYTTQSGRYIRIGPLVWCYLELNFTPTHTTASGAARATGLPFACGSGFASATGTFDIVTSPSPSWPTGTTMVTCRAITNTTEMDFLATGSGATRANLTTSQFPTATARRFICNIAYYTDD